MTPSLTYKNHFKFGYNGELFNFRRHQSDQWQVSYGECEEKVQSFGLECQNTARKIKENGSGKITVLFSGGIDSEVALLSFHQAKIEVTASIMRFNDGLNAHDISYALKTCEALGIKYKFFDLDIKKFWENSLLDFATPVYCLSPQLAATMWLVDQVDEYPVIGSGECLIERKFPFGSWNLYEKERIAAWYRHFIIRNRPGCPGFFQYTPELMLSYLTDPLVTSKTAKKFSRINSSKVFKNEMYSQYFKLETRPKFTGFEKLQVEDAYYRKKLYDLFPGSDATYQTPVNDLVIKFKG
jgi:hypothetical protein